LDIGCSSYPILFKVRLPCLEEVATPSLFLKDKSDSVDGGVSFIRHWMLSVGFGYSPPLNFIIGYSLLDIGYFFLDVLLLLPKKKVVTEVTTFLISRRISSTSQTSFLHMMVVAIALLDKCVPNDLQFHEGHS